MINEHVLVGLLAKENTNNRTKNKQLSEEITSSTICAKNYFLCHHQRQKEKEKSEKEL